MIRRSVVGQFHVNSPGVAHLIDHRRDVNSKLTHYPAFVFIDHGGQRAEPHCSCLQRVMSVGLLHGGKWLRTDVPVADVMETS